MNIRSLIVPALMAATMAGCQQGSNDALVNGNIENASGQRVIFQSFKNGNPTTLDSTKIEADGNFSIPQMAIGYDFYRLMLGDKKQGLLMVVDSTSHLQVTANADKLTESWKVKGSEDTKLLLEFIQNTNNFKGRMDSLLQANPKLAKSKNVKNRQKLRKMQQGIIGEYREYALSFVNDHTVSPAALVAVNNLNIKSELDKYKEVRDQLKDELSGSIYWKQLDQKVSKAEKRAEKMKKFEPGKPAPNIELQNPAGKVVSLESLEGKVVLVDFWASWCKPCRRENPNVKRVYNQYKDDGFEIYGVSLDKTKDKWVKAIKQDGLPWVQVSDLKGWKSAAAQLYQVRSIPHTVLLDRDGKIIETGLRGQSLEEKLEEIFPKG